jgi:hypothetical protein
MGRRHVAETPSGSKIPLRRVAPRSSGSPKGMERRSGDSFGLKNGTEQRSGGSVVLKNKARTDCIWRFIWQTTNELHRCAVGAACDRPLDPQACSWSILANHRTRSVEPATCAQAWTGERARIPFQSAHLSLHFAQIASQPAQIPFAGRAGDFAFCAGPCAFRRKRRGGCWNSFRRRVCSRWTPHRRISTGCACENR